MNSLIAHLRIHKFRKAWRKQNIHNFTVAGNIFPIEKVKIGYYTYGQLNIHCYGSDQESISIGNYCSIAQNVNFLLGGEHQTDNLSTYPFLNKFLGEYESKSKGKIIIEDDVWIGFGTTVLSGVQIGQGAIIAAGSTIHKSVPPYAIATGERIIRYRFGPEIISKLLLIDWGKIKNETFLKYKLFFTQKVDENNIDEFLRFLASANMLKSKERLGASED